MKAKKNQNKSWIDEMNRFEFIVAALTDGETVVVKHDSVKIYDGHEKVIHILVHSLWIFSRTIKIKPEFV